MADLKSWKSFIPIRPTIQSTSNTPTNAESEIISTQATQLETDTSIVVGFVNMLLLLLLLLLKLLVLYLLLVDFGAAVETNVVGIC